MKALVSPAQAPPARQRRRTPRSRPVFGSRPRRYAAVTVSDVSGRPCKASGGHRKDARGVSIIGLSMAALPCCAEEDVEAGCAALRFDWPVYPRRTKHNTVAEGGIEYGPRLRLPRALRSSPRIGLKTPRRDGWGFSPYPEGPESRPRPP
jgi:hypothetical protein